MKSLTLTLTDITKRYGRKPIFEPVTFTARSSSITSVIGANGTGKTTLLKMIAGVLSPSTGKCIWADEHGELDRRSLQKRIGYAAPYLQLYNDLTAKEHLQLVADMKELGLTNADELLAMFGLDTKNIHSKYVRDYSSGMLQRLRAAMAFACSPDALLLDEPSSNLDPEGTSQLLNAAKEFAVRGGLVIIATNDERERSIADAIIEIHPS